MSFSLTLILFFSFNMKMAQINLDSRHGMMFLITSAPVKVTQLQRQKCHDFQRKTLVEQRLGILIYLLSKPIELFCYQREKERERKKKQQNRNFIACVYAVFLILFFFSKIMTFWIEKLTKIFLSAKINFLHRVCGIQPRCNVSTSTLLLLVR